MFSALSLLLLIVPIAMANKWSYDGADGSFGPSQWYKFDPRCRGWRQTPIELTPSKMTYSKLPKITAVLPSDTPKDKISQNGKTVKVAFKSTTKFRLDASDSHTLVADHVHFHWGDESNRAGSEHTVNQIRYPIEGHIVTFNQDYCKDLTAAVSSPTCLYVIGFFYKIVEKPKQTENAISIILKALRDPGTLEKINKGEEVDIDHVQPRKLFPEDVSKFFRYSGSLTTPPCTQNVMWTVFEEPIEITADDFLAFTKITNGKTPIINNFRPLQLLNGPLSAHPRIVYSSYETSSALSVAAASVISVNLIGSVAGVVAMGMIQLLASLRSV